MKCIEVDVSDTPTTRSMRLLRKQGWLVAVVEKWNPHKRIRQDLFGFADLIAVDKVGKRFLLVQTTSSANFASRWRKVNESEHAADWLEAGGNIAVHGWRKKSNGRWECREEVLGGDANGLE